MAHVLNIECSVSIRMPAGSTSKWMIIYAEENTAKFAFKWNVERRFHVPVIVYDKTNKLVNSMFVGIEFLIIRKHTTSARFAPVQIAMGMLRLLMTK